MHSAGVAVAEEGVADMAIGVVVNPIAGGRRMGRAWPGMAKVLAARLGALDIRMTGEAGEACDLARQLAMAGAELVIAAGGDGTVSDVANGLLQARAEDGARADLAVLAVGTGSDFARGLKLGSDPARLAARIAAGERRTLDAGRVSFVNDDGALASRHFINIASLGVSGTIDRAVNAGKRSGILPGKLTFLWHTVRGLMRYRFQDVRVIVDDGEPLEAAVALVAIANAPYFGGGMKIAPDAAPDDGMLEVVIVRGTSKPKLIADLRLVYSGSHGGSPFCTILRGRKVVVEPKGDDATGAPLLDVDGESPGRIPATFEVIPGAIMLRG